MTLQQLCIEGTDKLKQAGIAEAELDARYLLLEAYGLTPNDFLLQRGDLLDRPLDMAVYREMVAKRSRRIPLQYILGTQNFMGLEFQVDERVLIPRQDTEDLVELILKEHSEKHIRILDLCTGSGCIAIALAVLGGYEQVDAADISADALLVAQDNARRLGAADRVKCLQSDLYQDLKETSCYDFIVSNPPYIPTRVICGLQPEVRDFEPMLALDGSEDGLHFYRKLAKESGRYLRLGGKLYLEIGYDQAEPVCALLREQGYTKIQVIQDTPGLDRIVTANYIGGFHV
ncbi:MAG: peptide chain release factor N(5)-glutamine methyltransferase [Hungatella sp.]